MDWMLEVQVHHTLNVYIICLKESESELNDSLRVIKQRPPEVHQTAFFTVGSPDPHSFEPGFILDQGIQGMHPLA